MEIGFVGIVEVGHEAEIVVVGDGVVFVGVALRAAGGKAKPSRAGGGDAVGHGVVAELERIDTAFFIEHGVAMKAGGDDLLGRGVGEHVAGELLDGELVEGLVGIERLDDVVAVGPDGTVAVFFVAVGVGVSGEVKPATGPAFAVTRRGEEFVDDLGEGVRGWVGGEAVGNFDGRRKADEVEVEAADESVGIGLIGEVVFKQVIDGMLVGGNARSFRVNEGPVGFVFRAFIDPAFDEFDFFGLESLVGLGRRHDVLGIGRGDAIDHVVPVLRVFDVEAKTGLSEGFAVIVPGIVWSVALVAIGGEDGPDVAGEGNFLGLVISKYASDVAKADRKKERGERNERMRHRAGSSIRNDSHLLALFPQRKEFDGLELNGCGFGLDGNPAFGERGPVVELCFVVFADDLSFGDVLKFVATDFDFHGDPFIAMGGGAACVDDVALGEFAFPMEVGSRGADVERATITLAKAAEELHFNRVWKVLLFLDGLGILAMEHEAVVAIGPAWAAGDLLADEAVGRADLVVGVGCLVVEVAEFAAELFPLGVVDGEESVLNLEGVLVIHTQVRAFEFRSPAGEIFAIEELNPVFFFAFLSMGDAESENSEEKLFFDHVMKLGWVIRQCNGHSSLECFNKKHLPSKRKVLSEKWVVWLELFSVDGEFVDGPEEAVSAGLGDADKLGIGGIEVDRGERVVAIAFGEGAAPFFAVFRNVDFILPRVVTFGTPGIEGDCADFGKLGKLDLNPHSGFHGGTGGVTGFWVAIDASIKVTTIVTGGEFPGFAVGENGWRERFEFALGPRLFAGGMLLAKSGYGVWLG